MTLGADHAWADTGYTSMTSLDERGTVVHVVPRPHGSVRMVREKVVLVPFLDAGQPRMLVHVWYDFADTAKGGQAVLPVGFPELKAAYRYEETKSGGAGGYGHPDTTAILKRSLPTIVTFAARVGTRWLEVATHRGVARYRRWFTYGLPLASARPTRVHNLYVARFRESRSSTMGAHVGAFRSASHGFTYLLHTGATWHGTIGEGSVWLWTGGGLVKVKAFKNLEPTPKDDVHLSLDFAKLVGANDHLDRDTRLRILRSRLVFSDSYQGAKPLPHYPALAVDGDAGTWWVAGKSAATPLLQVPSSEASPPRSIRITLPPKAAGVARPKTIQVMCITQPKPKAPGLDDDGPGGGPGGGDQGGEDLSMVEPPWPSERERQIALWKVPNTPGPHELKISGADKEPKNERELKAMMKKRCDAVRLVFLSTHGGGAPGIAEVHLGLMGTQSLEHVTVQKAQASGTGKASPVPTLRPGDKDLAGLRFAPAGAAGGPAFEQVGISDVRFSADGTLAHYRLWVEDELRRPARAAVIGYFVDVASGKVRRTYRIDKAGTLPEPYATHWKRGMGFLEAMAVLKKGGFTRVRAERFTPRRSVVKGLRLDLKGQMDRKRGLIRLRPRRWGWQWWYQANKYTKSGPATAGSLALRAFGAGGTRGAPKTIREHAPFLDQGLALAHAKIRDRRRELFVKAIESLPGHQYAYEALDSDKDGRIWWQHTYRRIHAFDGEVQIYWHPRAESALTVWVDRRELSTKMPDPKPDDLVPECRSVCPWERRDYGLQRVVAGVHAFVPKSGTTLLAAWTPPAPAPKPVPMGPAMEAGTKKPAGASMKAAGKKDGGRKKKGCGCSTGAPSAGIALLLLGAFGWARRRRAR